MALDFQKDRYKKIGYLGECYVILELAKKGIFAQKVYDLFDFDLLVNQGLKVEVKTSSINQVKSSVRKNGDYKLANIWQFRNYENQSYDKGRIKRPTTKGRNRECDFYVFVCLDKFDKPLKYFIVPSNIIKTKECITIRCEPKKPYELSIFENRWDLLENQSNELYVENHSQDIALTSKSGQYSSYTQANNQKEVDHV